MSRARTAAALGSALAALLVSRATRADGSLVVEPTEGGSWAAQVAAVQSAERAPGVAFHVRVLEDDTRRVVPCGRYALSLDADGARGLALGECDPATAATAVIVIDRAALFAPGDPVPLPRTIAVHAVAIRQGGAAGGVAPAGGVELRCSATVRPFVRDALRGLDVFLSPERYRLEPLESAVRADPGTDFWTVSVARDAGLLESAFRVVDLGDGREVLRSRVALSCAVGDAGPGRAYARARFGVRAEDGSASAPFRLPPGAVGRGSTRGGISARASCGDGAAPSVVWRFVAPADGAYEVLLQGSFDTVLEVREADGAPESIGCSDDDRGRAQHSRVAARLVRGRGYDLLISGRAAASGRYELAVIPIPGDIEAAPTSDGLRVTRFEP